MPLATAVTSVVWTLGLMAWLGIPVNVMTSIVPALLIIIGSTEDIHLLAEYHARRGEGLSPRKGMKRMARNMGLAVTLTFLTTWMGFASIAFNSLDLLRQFGLIASSGLLFNFAITVLLVPALIRLFPGSGKGGSEKPVTWPGRAVLAMTGSVLRHRRRSLWLIGVLVLVMAAGIPRLQVNNNVMSYFREGSEVARAARVLEENLSGIQSFSVVISGPPGTFLTLAGLEALQEAQELLAESGRVELSLSLADLISVVHGGLDSKVPGRFYLPERDAAVEAYSGFLDASWLSSFVSTDFRQARIIVRHSVASSRELNALVDDFLAKWRSWGWPGLEARVTGESYLNNRAVDYMAGGQVYSLLLMLLVILSLFFMRLRVGIIAVAVNLFPVLVLFGIMGWTGFSLDVGTAMVGAIALGIAVDHTMHFMVRYQRAFHRSHSMEQALRTAVLGEASPIVSTSLALALGFAVLTVSGLPPVARFGVLSAVVILEAMVGTFVLLPLLLQGTRLVGAWELLSMKLRREVIGNCPLFDGLRSWQVRRVLGNGWLKRCEADRFIAREEESAEGISVLLDGRAELWQRSSDRSSHRVSTLKPGEVFDLSGLLSGRKRSSSVVAMTRCQVATISWSDVNTIARYHPRIAFHLYQNLSRIVFLLLSDSEQAFDPVRDEVTGAYSATYLGGALKNALARSWREGRPLCIVVLNIRDNGSEGRDWVNTNLRCPPWRAKRRRVVPGSREATRDTRRAEGAKGDPKGASERGVQSYGRPVCSRNELAMLWRNAG